ncbi:hypothetical protein FNF29_04367 [Cafeteria roenbergensis]|uniref:Protein kinase domain-containing protein n=1 Tax=Cafeteria roenbergensis TaxID=33653 RepID=A0A5A8CIM0_CAFRO|nr:hypothetical protein FNF29_04367 [Cafeteria roenbergensis]KAA0167399.1 hypothetical protein FNF31_00840 [Cafeteria roenbergensis]KAA0172318.1 hypothetical protein FNF28_00002 [Cafeteria roenbergensis]|eukprot:KAA0151681.1 hypothetical protein FNF29_04367 [Cafeteria roenbergensis]
MATTGVYIDIIGFCVVADAVGNKQIVFAVSIRLNSYSWTVYRSHDALEALRDQLGSAPPVPAARVVDSREAFEQSRQEILRWIHSIVSDNTLCSKPEFHDFLRAAANTSPTGIVAAFSRNPSEPVAGDMTASAAAAAASSPPPPAPAAAAAAAAPAQEPLPAPGAMRARVSDFALLKVLGRGSFGKVMLVKKHEGGHVYAMKVLQKEHIRKRKQVANTKTERDILVRVRHPFIVGLKYAFQTADKLYFVMDYCPGGELFFHLGRQGSFHEGRAKFYTAQILLALEHLHSLGVVYRDLKPENVLLDAHGNVKITDFGLSKAGVTGSAAGATSFCGTPEYLPPEVVKRLEYGTAADWWSLGALLHEMLTGWPPFFSQDRAELFRRIAGEELVLPEGLTPEAADLLRRLLHKDPLRRLGSVGGAAGIRAHPFFAGVDWEALYDCRIPAPWTPRIDRVDDVQFFDKEFTGKPAVLSPPPPEAAGVLAPGAAGPAGSSSAAAAGAPAGGAGDHFAGFSYAEPASSMVRSRMHGGAAAPGGAHPGYGHHHSSSAAGASGGTASPPVYAHG